MQHLVGRVVADVTACSNAGLGLCTERDEQRVVRELAAAGAAHHGGGGIDLRHGVGDEAAAEVARQRGRADGACARPWQNDSEIPIGRYTKSGPGAIERDVDAPRREVVKGDHRLQRGDAAAGDQHLARVRRGGAEAGGVVGHASDAYGGRAVVRDRAEPRIALRGRPQTATPVQAPAASRRAAAGGAGARGPACRRSPRPPARRRRGCSRAPRSAGRSSASALIRRSTSSSAATSVARRAAVAGEQRERRQRARHLVHVALAQRGEADRRVGEQLDRRAARGARDHGPEQRVVRDADEQLHARLRPSAARGSRWPRPAARSVRFIARAARRTAVRPRSARRTAPASVLWSRPGRRRPSARPRRRARRRRRAASAGVLVIRPATSGSP